MSLPRGIWYEEKRNRYRVRLYRNNVKYLIGYFPTKEEAMNAWRKAKEDIGNIPKLRKNQKHTKRLYSPNAMSGLIAMVSQERDPNSSLS